MRARGVKVGFIGITASKMPELFRDHADFIFNGEPEAVARPVDLEAVPSVLRGKLGRKEIRASLLQATRTAAAVFTVLIGALLFGYFLTITQTPQKVTMFLTGLGLGRYGVLALIMVMYLVLGCLMDALAMVILTVPIIFPVIRELGFDPIWFGVIIVMTVELGLIHPPVGMIVFVIKSVVPDVSFSTIFKGVLPFIVTDLVRLVILIAFPIIALWLPSRM